MATNVVFIYTYYALSRKLDVKSILVRHWEGRRWQILGFKKFTLPRNRNFSVTKKLGTEIFGDKEKKLLIAELNTDPPLESASA